ncbi:MAG: XrtA system polysaccharide deacetylase [Pseudohongiellaceae bacterium]
MMRHPDSRTVINAMSVDVEDYFQVSAFAPHVARDSWETTPLRVEANVDRILELFHRHNVKATFFTLGWVAERLPDMVRRIVAEGHELASHGWEHMRVNAQQPETFRADITRTRSLLEDIGAVPVRGYRAASYSIGGDTPWAHEVLADAGYHYSSSIVPVRHDHYGSPDASRFAFPAADGRITEIPVTTVNLAGRNINCGGGGWFRLFPYRFSRWALRHINEREGESGLFYFHPWEIDPQQPRPERLTAKTRFRHYLNLSRMEPRLECLLQDFHWDRMDRVFADVIGAPAAMTLPELKRATT